MNINTTRWFKLLEPFPVLQRVCTGNICEPEPEERRIPCHSRNSTCRSFQFVSLRFFYTMKANSPEDSKRCRIDLNTFPKSSGKSSRVIRSHMGNTFTDDWNTALHNSNESEIGGLAAEPVAIANQKSDAPTVSAECNTLQMPSKRRQAIDVVEHRCNTCKKVFNSSQALGGHRSRSVACNCESPGDRIIPSNDKSSRQLFESHVDDGRRSVAPQYRSRPGQRPRAVTAFSDGKKTKTYECSCCHRRVFKDFRALGGHMRKCILRNPGNRVAEVAGRGRLVDSKEGGLLSLNLNLPPPDE